MSRTIAPPSAPAVAREIPYNQTSADDRQALRFLLGETPVALLDELREQRVTGRSARLLHRVCGELLVHLRNPYLQQELLDDRRRRARLASQAERDLRAIELQAQGDARVLAVLAATRTRVAEFHAELERTLRLRPRLRRELGALIGPEQVRFDPFTRVAHATDATDWRLHLPLAVVFPGEEAQVAPLLAAIGRMGLHAIPRGAGTGLTGGAIPLSPTCVVINLERLDRIRSLHSVDLAEAGEAARPAMVLEAEAGVVTETAMAAAHAQGFVFATDPTSAWASTLGGNISENAGGKLAVRWGTCLDNLLEWRMAMPDGQRWTIRRLGHPLRKLQPEDVARFRVIDESERELALLELRGSEIRKPGLWKDITNKALGGLPGVQKEGTDGVITSATFVLHRPYPVTRTLCLEFFGPDMEEAAKVILGLSEAFPDPEAGNEALLALEHFDEAYVAAIAYAVKSLRPESPRAVLLVDLGAPSPEAAERGVQRIRALLEGHPNTECFLARSPAEAQRFWADRKRLGAIARRTNAFKLNEDVVIPLPALAEFARFIADVNLALEGEAHRDFLDRVERHLQALRVEGEDRTLADKVAAALASVGKVRSGLGTGRPSHLRLQALRQDLAGHLSGFPELIAALEAEHSESWSRRLLLATHMHAGDGNVHVNVPVRSSDRPMMQRADEVVDAVMAKVMRLGGVVSGEHGIGVTKLKYLDQDRVEALNRHRKAVDPQGMMNPGKLQDRSLLAHLFTPSFNLLELEARILQNGQLEALSQRIAPCVRCGKCKPDCSVFHPAKGLFYHPRNKNLAIGALIEALLYDAQHARSGRFELLSWLQDVADHCTVCHRCHKPCPVDIDSGEVSVMERQILRGHGITRKPVLTRLTLRYLDSRSSTLNRVFRLGVLKGGGLAQRTAHRLVAPLLRYLPVPPPRPLRMLQSSVPPVSRDSLRDVLPTCRPDQVLCFEPQGKAQRTVLYFPGCGSERLQGDVGMAAVHLLLESGTRVILAPPYLCCGFPAHANAREDLHARTTLRDTILLTQIRDMFGHFGFAGCVVTCGTCREGLEGLGAAGLFGGRVIDLAAFLTETGLRVEDAADHATHAPCHDALEGRAPQVLQQLGLSGKLHAVPHCCSEAGTLALSRPDISEAMRSRKREALLALREAEPTLQRVLTHCPSCLQGLGRNRDTGLQPVHVAVHLAERLSGPQWERVFRRQASGAKAISF